MRSSAWLVTVAVGLMALDLPAALGRKQVEQYAWRWVYCPCNFQVDANVDRLLELMESAKRAGYNGIIISDYKFGRIQGRPDNYYGNLVRTRQTADRLGLDLIPCVMPIGWSTSILQNNPNLLRYPYLR